MNSWSFTLFSLGIVLLKFGSIQGISAQDRSTLIATVFPHVIECSSKFEIGADISKLLDNPTNMEDVNPCLVACIMKRLKLMDDKGMYDEHKGKKISKKLFPSDDDQKNLNQLAESCVSVNEKEVSDGEKGCDRAKLLLECFLPHKELEVLMYTKGAYTRRRCITHPRRCRCRCGAVCKHPEFPED